MGRDRFSNLPDHVMEKILSLLPIRDAVRTSVLATTWRTKWADLPSLVFDEQDFPYNRFDDFGNKLAKVIDHVLSHHPCPIQKFKVVCTETLPKRSVKQWIRRLSASPIKEFILDCQQNTFESVKIPPCLFSCQNLTHLDLSCCVMKLPTQFEGFANLKSLGLKDVLSSKDDYEKLITSCPVLESLTLCLFPEDDLSLNVDAPNLQSLELHGNISDVSLQNMTRLAVASVRMEIENPKSFLESFANLPKLRKLEFGVEFIECLRNFDWPWEMLQHSANIQSFSAEVDFYSPEHTSAALGVLQGMPNLEELNIKLAFSDSSAHMKHRPGEFDNLNCSFTKLRCIKITEIFGYPREIDFINYLHSHSPVLESMIVMICDGRIEERTLVNQLRVLREALPFAQITRWDP